MADPIDTGKKTVTGRTIWRDPETKEEYSERTTTVEINGKYYTMPTVDAEGNQYSDDVIREYVKENGPIDFITGEELPEFRYREDAIEYAISRSDTRKQKEEPMLEEQMEMFNEGGLRDEGGTVDPDSGNDVPIGSTKKEVRDDIPAMLSEGEFVLPADVVRYIGLENLMRLRQDAKMGLKQMEAMGQMGNSDEATLPDDMPFGPTDIIILGKPEEDEPKEMNQGGIATGIGGYQPSVFQNQVPMTAGFTPPSTVAPPTPTPAPTGGFIPSFVYNESIPTTVSGAPVTTPAPVVSTPVTATQTTPTEDKFVPTAEDQYYGIQYINETTGEIRTFYFYQGNPVTPIPDGFVPYTPPTDDDLGTGTDDPVIGTGTDDPVTGTGVDTTSVRGDRSLNIIEQNLQKEIKKIDFSKYGDTELLNAFEQNRIGRMGLNILGLANPLFLLFGQFATRRQEAEIVAELEKRGITPPEVNKNIFTKIVDGFTNILGIDKKQEIEQAIIDTEKVASPVVSSVVSDPRLAIPTGSLPTTSTPTTPYIPEDPTMPTPLEPRSNVKALRDRIERDKSFSTAQRDLAIASARVAKDAGFDLAKYGRAYSERKAEIDARLGRKDPDALDPRGPDQRGLTAQQTEDMIEQQRVAANEAARIAAKERRKKRSKAEKAREAAVKKAKSISKSVKGKGAAALSASKPKSFKPFAKGGLASRK